MLPLSEEAKLHINNYLSLLDVYHMEYNTLNYLAGLLDFQKLIAHPTLFQNNISDTDKVILNFYKGYMQQLVKDCDSENTMGFWKKFIDEKNRFISTLTLEQVDKFLFLFGQEIDGTNYSKADSFVQGFKSCSNLLELLLINK